MPQFGLRSIYAAKYNNTAGVISYTGIQHVGDAITANLELRYAEGRLYAEDMLAEYMRKAVGGSISIGVKYITQAAQQLLFSSKTKTRTVNYTPAGGSATSVEATSVVLGGEDEGQYVGVAFFAPDSVDSVKKYTCVLIKKALFGPPSMNFQTMGESLTFQTPTTTGEFLADDSATHDLIEVAIVDDIEAAKAWVQSVLGGT